MKKTRSSYGGGGDGDGGIVLSPSALDNGLENLGDTELLPVEALDAQTDVFTIPLSPQKRIPRNKVDI